MGYRVLGFGFWVLGLGFRVWGLGLGGGGWGGGVGSGEGERVPMLHGGSICSHMLTKWVTHVDVERERDGTTYIFQTTVDTFIWKKKKQFSKKELPHRI